VIEFASRNSSPITLVAGKAQTNQNPDAYF
jgi:hypothetical protein